MMKVAVFRRQEMIYTIKLARVRLFSWDYDQFFVVTLVADDDTRTRGTNDRVYVRRSFLP